MDFLYRSSILEREELDKSVYSAFAFAFHSLVIQY